MNIGLYNILGLIGCQPDCTPRVIIRRKFLRFKGALVWHGARRLDLGFDYEESRSLVLDISVRKMSRKSLKINELAFSSLLMPQKKTGRETITNFLIAYPTPFWSISFLFNSPLNLTHVLLKGLSRLSCT